MRIGQINKDNYAQFVKMINPNAENVKAPTLDAPATSKIAKDHSVNPFEDPYLNITGKDPSEWRKIIAVDDNVAAKLKNLIKEDFVKRNGMCGDGAQADAQANIIKSYISTLPGEQRLAAIHSCEQIAFGEAERLVSIIRNKNPSWQYGQSFDTSILDKPPAKNLDIEA